MKFVVTGVVAITALGLSSCASEPEKASISATSTPKPTVTLQTPSPTLVTTTAPTPQILTGEKIDKSCEQVFPLERLYEFDPNIALVPGEFSISNEVTNKQIELGGISCSLTNLSSGITTQIVITKLSTDSVSIQKNLIDQAMAGGGYKVNNEISGSFISGTGQFLKNSYWVSVSSSSFGNAVEASQLSFLTAQGL